MPQTYTIHSDADTRSKTRASRTWVIEADSIDDACYEARQRHLAIVGWNASIWTTVEGWKRNRQTGQWEQS